MSDELLPCPFCGGPAEFTGTEAKGYRVECRHCGGQGGWGDYGYQAEAKWNRRAPVRSGVDSAMMIHPQKG